MLLSKQNNAPFVMKILEAGFNPYFSGCFSLSVSVDSITIGGNACFNPYFSGCFSLSFPKYAHSGREIAVSILIFLDASL